MGARERRGASASLRLAVELHDVSGDLAVGIALLKGWREAEGTGKQAEPDRAIEVFELVLAELRHLLRTVSRVARSRPVSLRESLELEAKTAGIVLELILAGKESWLSRAQAELVRLTGREAIRNVKRHSGSKRCRLAIDFSSCPFVLTARDWGAGIQSESRPGGGIALLEALADEMGAALTTSSQPGMGVELTLTGPRCVLARSADRTTRQQASLRSVVAEKSLGSRKRVAAGRPIEASGQQIT
jgi:signal transduction histidine kinase